MIKTKGSESSGPDRAFYRSLCCVLWAKLLILIRSLRRSNGNFIITQIIPAF